MRVPDPKANTTTEAYLAYKAGYLEESELKPVLYEPDLHFDGWLAYWAGLVNTYPTKENGDPEMLCDEEALVAYLSGVTDTYPEEIKDPYDVRIVEYLKHLVSARWPEPDYPVNNQEFYLSTIKPPVVTNDTPSADIELDNTAEAPFIDVKAYGDTFQQTYSGKNLMLYNSYDADNGRVMNMPDLVLPIGTFTISFDLESFTLGTSDSIDIFLYLVDENGNSSYDDGSGNKTIFTIDSSTQIGRYSYTFTTKAITHKNNTNFRIGATQYDNGARCKITNIQIESGSTATDYEPYVGGIPSPNPDYPQAVQVVTGEQNVEVHGKNLANPTIGVNQGSNNTSLVNIENGIRCIYNGAGGISGRYRAYIICEATQFVGDQLTMKAIYDGSSGGYSFGYCDGDATNRVRLNDSGTTTSGTDATGTVPEEASGKYIYLQFYANKANAQQGDYTDYTNIQLGVGSTATAYEPYQEATYPIDLVSKNLISLAPYYTGQSVYNRDTGYQFTSGTSSNVTITSTTDTTLSYDATASNGVLLVSEPVTVGQTYYISATLTSNENIRGTYYTLDANHTVVRKLRYINENNTSFVLTRSDTVNSGEKYFAFSLTSSNPASLSISNIQLEKGSQPTTYTPYFEPIELCKIGDYQDYIYKSGDDWYVHKAIKKAIFTGAEAWALAAGTYPFRHNIPDAISPLAVWQSEPPLVFVNSFSTIAWLDGVSQQPDYCVSNNASNNTLAVRDVDFTTVAEFQTYLSTNNMIVYYPLATPTDTQITDNTLIGQLEALVKGGSYEGKTYIKVTATDPNLPALLKVEAGKYD